MTPNTSDELSRRSVLRRGAIAGTVAAVGIGGFAGTALASNCPRTPGFWANHDWCAVLASPDTSVAESLQGSRIGESNTVDPCEDPDQFYYDLIAYDGSTPVVVASMTMSEWQAFLLQSVRGDKGVIMAKHVWAATLNFHRRPGGGNDTACSQADVDFTAYGLEETTTVGDVVARARVWLNHSSWPDTPQRSWTVDVGGTMVDGEPLKNVIDAFNNGTIAGLDCDCDGEEESGPSNNNRRGGRRN